MAIFNSPITLSAEQFNSLSRVDKVVWSSDTFECMLPPEPTIPPTTTPTPITYCIQTKTDGRFTIEMRVPSGSSWVLGIPTIVYLSVTNNSSDNLPLFGTGLRGTGVSSVDKYGPINAGETKVYELDTTAPLGSEIYAWVNVDGGGFPFFYTQTDACIVTSLPYSTINAPTTTSPPTTTIEATTPVPTTTLIGPIDPGPAPTPPIDQPYPPRPILVIPAVDFPPPPACPVEPLPVSVFPVHNQACINSWPDFTYRDITNRVKASIDQARWDAQVSASSRGFPFVSAPTGLRPLDNAYEGDAQIGFAGETTANGITYSLVGWTPFNTDIADGWYILDYRNELYMSSYSPSGDPAITHWAEVGEWGATCKAIQAANSAASSAHATAMASWLSAKAAYDAANPT